MNQLELAVHKTAHGFPGGLPALAAAMDLKPGILKNKVDPECMANRLALDEAMQMMLLSGSRAILIEMARELGCEVVERTGLRQPCSIITELLREQKEHGDVAALLSQVLEDNRVTPREAFNVAREIDDEIASLTM